MSFLVIFVVVFCSFCCLFFLLLFFLVPFRAFEWHKITFGTNSCQFNINNYIKRLQNPNKQQQQEIKQEITDGDLTRYFGRDDYNNIIKYNELDNYNSIEQLLPSNKSWKIILIENEYNSGHWTLIMRYNNTIEWFNSYGTFPSEELDYIPNYKNQQLEQTIKYLNILLTKGLNKFKIIYNKKKFQKLEDNINPLAR